MTPRELELTDALTGIEVALEKARYVMQEVIERFFDKFNPDKEDEGKRILYEFKRYAAFARVVDDILYDMESIRPHADAVGEEGEA